MGLKEELIKALSELDLEKPKFELQKTVSGKIGGVVVSKSFDGKSQIDRQNMIWDHLEKKLGKAKARKIIAVLTLTPAEAEGTYSKI